MLQILGQENGDSSNFDVLKSFLYIAAIVLAALLMMRWAQRRSEQSRRRSLLSVRERVSQMKAGTDIHSQIGELMGQLADLSRQINGEIDTRLAKLEILLRDADQTISQLEKLTGKESKTQPLPPSEPTGKGAEAIRKITEDFQQPKRAESSKTSTPMTEKTNKTEEKSEESESPASSQNNVKNSIEKQQILEMSEQGMSPVEIAQELNRPIGEIELILALKGKKNS